MIEATNSQLASLQQISEQGVPMENNKRLERRRRSSFIGDTYKVSASKMEAAQASLVAVERVARESEALIGGGSVLERAQMAPMPTHAVLDLEAAAAAAATQRQSTLEPVAERRAATADTDETSSHDDDDASVSGESSMRRRTDLGEARMSLSFHDHVDLSRADVSGGALRSWVASVSFPGANEDGQTKTNQDYGCSMLDFNQGSSALFGVCDGHGMCGHRVSHQALATIVEELEVSGDTLHRDPEAALTNAFEATQEHLRAHLKAYQEATDDELHERGWDRERFVDSSQSGTCAVVVYAQADEGTDSVSLWVSGVGDCRAILGTRGETGDGDLHAVALTTDHKCDTPVERARIEAMGGYVSRPSAEGEEFRPARLYRSKDHPWLGPGLCTSRGLGDFDGGDCGLISTPEVCRHRVAPGDQFLLLASDGVWEFIDNEDAVGIVDSFYSKGLDEVMRGIRTNHRVPASKACAHLVAKSAFAWRVNEGYYRDDITVIVIWLPDLVHNLLSNRDAANAKIVDGMLRSSMNGKLSRKPSLDPTAASRSESHQAAAPLKTRRGSFMSSRKLSFMDKGGSQCGEA